MNLRSVAVAVLAVAACGRAHPKPATPSPYGIGTPMPAACTLTTPVLQNAPPLAFVARTADELTAAVACPGGPSLPELLKVDFRAHHVAVVSIETGTGSVYLNELKDDGATLTVVVLAYGGGCSGIEYRKRAMFTIPVPVAERAIQVEVVAPAPTSAAPCRNG